MVDTTALRVSGVSLVLCNIKDTWPVCASQCVFCVSVCTQVSVAVLFMCSIFLGVSIFHSLCSTLGQQQWGGVGWVIPQGIWG